MIVKARRLEWEYDASRAVSRSLAPDGVVYEVWQVTGQTYLVWKFEQSSIMAVPKKAKYQQADSLQAAQDDAQAHWDARAIGFLDQAHLERVNVAYALATDLVRDIVNVSQAIIDAAAAVKAVDE
jgi:hypothetical protein